MEVSHAIAMVRMYIGDPAETFLTNALADGLTVLYDLPQQNINPVGLNVQYTMGSTTTTLLPRIVPGTQTTDNPSGVANFSAWNSATAYTAGALVTYQDNYYQCTQGNTNNPPTPAGNLDWTSDLTVYTLDSTNGILQVNNPLPLNATLVVNGQAWGMFTDTDLTSIIWDASRQHCQGQTLTERYRNANGGGLPHPHA